MRHKGLLGWSSQERLHRYTLAEAAEVIGKHRGHTRALLFHLGYHGHRPCDPHFTTTWDASEVDAVRKLLGQRTDKEADPSQADWLDRYTHLKEGSSSHERV